jgi:hypothetical protein
MAMPSMGDSPIRGPSQNPKTTPLSTLPMLKTVDENAGTAN